MALDQAALAVAAQMVVPARQIPVVAAGPIVEVAALGWLLFGMPTLILPRQQQPGRLQLLFLAGIAFTVGQAQAASRSSEKPLVVVEVSAQYVSIHQTPDRDRGHSWRLISHPLRP